MYYPLSAVYKIVLHNLSKKKHTCVNKIVCVCRAMCSDINYSSDYIEGAQIRSVVMFGGPSSSGSVLLTRRVFKLYFL